MSEMAGTPIGVADLHPVGRGADRPEHILVTGDGRVFASDKASAVAELLDENTVRRMGQAGGEPNGIALDRTGHFLIANFGSGVLQDLDPVTGAITAVLSGQLDGRPLRWLNFVLVDSAGALWCSVSTMADDVVDTLARGTADVVWFPAESETPRLPKRFGPPLGGRRPDEFGPDHGRFLADPQVGRRWGMADGSPRRPRRRVITRSHQHRLVPIKDLSVFG